MKNYILILVVIVAFTSCSSPLSDVAISDPSVIYPNIKLSISNTDYGTNSTTSIALNDKNGAFIELKEGEVTLNDSPTTFSMTTYSNNSSLTEGTDYNINITLADSVSYLNTVTMPSTFRKVKYPSKIKQGENIEVTWKDNYDGISKVEFEIKDSTDQWITIFEQDINDNEIILEIDYPKYSISEGKLKLSRYLQGNLADGFGGGGIRAYTTYDRIITIK